MNLLVHFVDLWSLMVFWKFSNCTRPRKFDNFQNFARAHKGPVIRVTFFVQLVAQQCCVASWAGLFRILPRTPLCATNFCVTKSIRQFYFFPTWKLVAQEGGITRNKPSLLATQHCCGTSGTKNVATNHGMLSRSYTYLEGIWEHSLFRYLGSLDHFLAFGVSRVHPYKQIFPLSMWHCIGQFFEQSAYNFPEFVSVHTASRVHYPKSKNLVSHSSPPASEKCLFLNQVLWDNEQKTKWTNSMLYPIQISRG